jgi:Type IV secretion-system coupling protein DNA-binding domain
MLKSLNDILTISHLVLVAKYLLVILVTSLLVYVLRRVVSIIFTLKTKQVVLEITPPSMGDQNIEANSQLMTSLWSLLYRKHLSDRILGKNDSLSLEIVSTKAEGIRYCIAVPKKHAATLKQLIHSYVPDAKVRRVADYLINDDSENKDGSKLLKRRVLEFKQSSHFAYPLKSHLDLEGSDPVGYLTTAMTKLDAGEQISTQLVIRPIKHRQAKIMRLRILRGEDVLPKLGGNKGARLSSVTRLINSFLFGILDLASSSYHTNPSKQSYSTQSRHKEYEYQKQVASGIKPARSITSFEQQLTETMSQKLAQPLFEADLRVLIQVKDKSELSTRRKNIESALGLYSVEEYQGFKLRLVKYYFGQIYARFAFRHRLPALLTAHHSILATGEVAELYHFPHTISAKTENVVKSLSKTLPAPISLKGTTKLDVLIGENHHHGQITPIGLTDDERQRHMYVVGGTGNGKTTLLKYQIVQDIKSGKGLAVIDPHGDLAEEILGYIPEDRIKDVIYINPDDLARPIGINLLELPRGLSGDELLREKDIVTESTVSVLRKIFSEDDSGGHRIEYVLRNTIQTALTMKEANLFTIFSLLNDAKYRKGIVNNLENEDLKIFWKNEIGKAGEMQRVKMAAGITAKIGRFLFSASAKRILEQNKSTISFDTAMDEKKIIICNFSKGLLGEDTSMLFGVTILAKLQLASLRRARQLQADRSPYYLYVDEFQNFATMSFVQMLSEARKYKLFLIMAEQSTQQQDVQRLVDIILANVGTVIAFRTGSPADERILLPLFKPYIEENELSNLPSYNFYARMSAITAQEPVSGMTVLLEERSDPEQAVLVKEYSRNRYGTKVEEKVEEKEVEVASPVVKVAKVVAQKRRAEQLIA